MLLFSLNSKVYNDVLKFASSEITEIHVLIVGVMFSVGNVGSRLLIVKNFTYSQNPPPPKKKSQPTVVIDRNKLCKTRMRCSHNLVVLSYHFLHIALEYSISVSHSLPICMHSSPFHSMLSETILVVARHCCQHWEVGQGKLSNK